MDMAWVGREGGIGALWKHSLSHFLWAGTYGMGDNYELWVASGGDTSILHMEGGWVGGVLDTLGGRQTNLGKSTDMEFRCRKLLAKVVRTSLTTCRLRRHATRTDAATRTTAPAALRLPRGRRATGTFLIYTLHQT